MRRKFITQGFLFALSAHWHSMASDRSRVSRLLLPTVLLFLLLNAVLSLSNEDDKELNLNTGLHQMKLKISHLESVLEERINSLNEKTQYIIECDKRIGEISSRILDLQSAISTIKVDSLNAVKRIQALEAEVQKLWASLRKNNFEIHLLRSKSEDTEQKLEALTLQAEKISDIVTEHWIQIQRLEQALKLAEIRTSKVQSMMSFTKCSFLKMSTMLHSYVFREKVMLPSPISDGLQYLQRIFRAVRKCHRQIQGFIREEMLRHELTAVLAHDEVVFFLASAAITIPVMSAWILLSSRLP